MSQDMPNTITSARRIFVYGEHQFDDSGAAYTTEQVRQHLQQYFPELAHATTEEKVLPDGTVEITFRKQVARKGSGDAGRLAPSASSELVLNTVKGLALLLDELERIPPYEDPLSELTAALGTEPLTLTALLDVQELLRSHAGDAHSLAGRTEQVVKRCLTLPPSPLHSATHGF